MTDPHRTHGGEGEVWSLTTCERHVSRHVNSPGRLRYVGVGRTLEDAAHDAVDDLVRWLSTDGLEPDEAYTLCSIAADLRVTHMVNGVVGAHAVIDRILAPTSSPEIKA